MLASRKGTYCLDLGGWLVRYTGVTVVRMEESSLLCCVRVQWQVLRLREGEKVDVTFTRRQGDLAVCYVDVASKRLEIQVIGVPAPES